MPVRQRRRRRRSATARSATATRSATRTIAQAIDAGAASVEALGAATRAGTGCGSCKTELAQILSKHAPAPKVAAAG